MLSVFVVFGFVSPDNAFSGLGHPATVTVALVLLISKGLEKSGFISFIGNKLENIVHSQFQFILILCSTAALLSSFMNNIGAMAMLLPIALGICRKMDWKPSTVLMPLAFASILGGMNTKIGTPPNIIISEMRNDFSDLDYSFLDFGFVGLPVCIFGIIFITIIGKKLIPLRKNISESNPLIELDNYLIEMKIQKDSSLMNKKVHQFRSELDVDTSLMGYINENKKKAILHANHKFFEDQVLIFKINPDDIADLQQRYKLKIYSEKPILKPDNDFGVLEAIIIPNSRLIGRKYNYFKRFIGQNFSLLGLWRKGLKFRFRLSNETFQSGDVLLLANRGEENKIGEKLSFAGLIPIWKREFDINKSYSKALFAICLFLASLCAVIFNYLPIIISFMLCVLAFAFTKLLSGESIYRHIDWPVVILLAAMIPIGNTLNEYGISSTIAEKITSFSSFMNLYGLLIIIMIITMFLSDIINNAATVVIMAPIAYNVSIAIGAPVDAFLMTVAIGASCAFLSPIGHQCNTLIMGPGNYKFGDYWRLGLPLEILIICVSIPLIIFFWT